MERVKVDVMQWQQQHMHTHDGLWRWRGGVAHVKPPVDTSSLADFISSIISAAFPPTLPWHLLLALTDSGSLRAISQAERLANEEFRGDCYCSRPTPSIHHIRTGRRHSMDTRQHVQPGCRAARAALAPSANLHVEAADGT